MGDVTVVERKHHSGLDADKAGITGILGDTYGASDSGKFYYWNASLAAWKTGLGYELVERLTGAADFDKTAFTCDGAWHVNGLDLSGIVPAGAVAVLLKVGVADDAASSAAMFRRDAVNVENQIQVKISVANVSSTLVQKVSIDSDRLLDYQCSNLVFTAIGVTVVGWYI